MEPSCEPYWPERDLAADLHGNRDMREQLILIMEWDPPVAIRAGRRLDDHL
jgi:hypothetical protein